MKKIPVVIALSVICLFFVVAAAQKAFYCKNCGTKFSSVQSLTASPCQRHPDGRGRHQLYEGSEKSSYTCKYCGRSSSSIRSLTSSKCQRHPKGPAKGYHSPAL